MVFKQPHQHKRRQEIGAWEAKTHFSELLAKVSLGEEFTITRHGQKVALIIPIPTHQRYSSAKEAIRAIKKLRAGITLGDDHSIKEMRSRGREGDNVIRFNSCS